MKRCFLPLFLIVFTWPILAACPTDPNSGLMIIAASPGGGFPPAPYDPGYTVQSCDTVTWNFGDGTPEVVVQGSNKVQHTFTESANVHVTARVSNSEGSATVQNNLVIGHDRRAAARSMNHQVSTPLVTIAIG